MRMRLRAPDEPEAENSYEGDGLMISAPSTPERRILPLDVGSPEYIEERLDNLKRRPKWIDFLDQYVQDHPGSDSEDESADEWREEQSQQTPGFLRTALWSLLVVTCAPLLLVCSPCVRHKGVGFWPLGCRSMKELVGCAASNVAFILLGLTLMYWTICHELPDFRHVGSMEVALGAKAREIQRSVDMCNSALLQWEQTVAQELCMPVGIDGSLLFLNGYLLLHCHRRWARYVMVAIALLFAVDMPSKLYGATFPAPEILKVDPTYAMVNEEIVVALDGKNLKPGGSVAWVAYWGCATTSNVDACEKQFPSTFEDGVVPVTFKSLDHYIPCYRDPPNPLKAQEYQCYANVRIRVKDKHSIPGWSRGTPQASQDLRPAEGKERLHSDEMHDEKTTVEVQLLDNAEEYISEERFFSPEGVDTRGDIQSDISQEESVDSTDFAQDDNLEGTPVEDIAEQNSSTVLAIEDEKSDELRVKDPETTITGENTTTNEGHIDVEDANSVSTVNIVELSDQEYVMTPENSEIYAELVDSEQDGLQTVVDTSDVMETDLPEVTKLEDEEGETSWITTGDDIIEETKASELVDTSTILEEDLEGTEVSIATQNEEGSDDTVAEPARDEVTPQLNPVIVADNDEDTAFGMEAKDISEENEKSIPSETDQDGGEDEAAKDEKLSSSSIVDSNEETKTVELDAQENLMAAKNDTTETKAAGRDGVLNEITPKEESGKGDPVEQNQGTQFSELEHDDLNEGMITKEGSDVTEEETRIAKLNVQDGETSIPAPAKLEERDAEAREPEQDDFLPILNAVQESNADTEQQVDFATSNTDDEVSNVLSILKDEKTSLITVMEDDMKDNLDGPTDEGGEDSEDMSTDIATSNSVESEIIATTEKISAISDALKEVEVTVKADANVLVDTTQSDDVVSLVETTTIGDKATVPDDLVEVTTTTESKVQDENPLGKRHKWNEFNSPVGKLAKAIKQMSVTSMLQDVTEGMATGNQKSGTESKPDPSDTNAGATAPAKRSKKRKTPAGRKAKNSRDAEVESIVAEAAGHTAAV